MKPELFEITTGRGEATRTKAAIAHKHLIELPRPYATPEPKFRFQTERSIVSLTTNLLKSLSADEIKNTIRYLSDYRQD